MRVGAGRLAHVDAIVVAALLLLSACGTQHAQVRTQQSAPTVDRPAGPARAMIVDTDLGADDVIALAMLLRHPGVDVRAVTVSGTGLVHCPGGATHVRAMFVELGVRDRPVGCGRGDAGPDGVAFPDPWRDSSDRFYDLQVAPPVMAGPTAEAAVAVLDDAISRSRTKVTVVALGPWTNLEDLVRRHPRAAQRIARIHAMAGAFDVPGNAPDGAEWNVRADPSAVAAVLRTDVPVTLVPLDATNAVPLDGEFFDRLSANPSAPAADLAWRLLDRNRFLLTSGQFLWDELAAVALIDPSVVRFETTPVAVNGTGALSRSDDGRELQAAVAAAGARAKDRILDVLRAREGG